MLAFTLSELLDDNLSLRPRKVALVRGDEQLTFSELFRAAGAAARELERSGASHAALLDVNSLAVPVNLFASAWAGLPCVPLNYRLTDEELDHFTGQLGAVLDHAAEGRLVPVIDRVMPLEEIREAERLMEDREVFGKIVVTP